jgi:hypothetical protein
MQMQGLKILVSKEACGFDSRSRRQFLKGFCTFDRWSERRRHGLIRFEPVRVVRMRRCIDVSVGGQERVTRRRIELID